MALKKRLMMGSMAVLALGGSVPSFAADHSMKIGSECHKTFTERPQRGGQFVYPERHAVPADKRSWDVAYPDYNPSYYRDHTVAENTAPHGLKWADPESKVNVSNLGSEEFKKFLATSGNRDIPRNPCGRTGIVGQGLLGKWGENWAADPIITRYDPKTGKLMALLIKRGDGGEWAIPGGMVDPGETKLSRTAARELKEETGLDVKMDGAQKVYEGIVDDSRNTDNSWMMTKAYHLHLDNPTSLNIEGRPLKPEDEKEIKGIEWVSYDDPRLNRLFASHSRFIKHVMELMPTKKIAPFSHEAKAVGKL